MICLEVSGGLGNQMFQIATGLSLSKDLKTELGVYLGVYKSSTATDQFTHRSFEIRRLFNQIKFEIVDSESYKKKTTPPRGLIDRIKRKVSGQEIYFEQTLNFDEQVLKIKPPAVLVGYFQTEKYFVHNKSEIKKAFEFDLSKLNKKSLELSKLIGEETLAIHVRRGDYVQNNYINSIHGACDLNYYKKAIEKFKNVKISQVYIFSDDPIWVKKNLRIDLPNTCIDWNSGVDSWQDMYLMTLCNHFIIANSSFSWWGAWLSNYQNKMIVAPQKWFNDVEKNKQTKDLIPTSWIVI